MIERPHLDEQSLDPDPIRTFRRWFDEALAAGLKEPTAMTLATSTPTGRPSARMVLLKGVDQQGFVFFTNYQSRKGRELTRNPHAALVFYWAPLERQVRVTGRVSKVDTAESDAYFESRPLGSRLSASISKQSSSVPSREFLEQKYAEFAGKYPNGDPPRPTNWGGFRVHPQEIEFWQGAANRLHDRLRYRLQRGGTWKVERLAP